jgi:adenylate kinase family enzyme
MRRVLIIGNSGGGKSTLARRLGAKLGLPVIHLDVLFWQAGWIESDSDDFRLRTAEALTGAAWICDGDFGSSLDVRLPLADTVLWIDQPRWICVARAIWRALSYVGGERPDMAEGCREKIDFEFYRYIWGWDRTRRPRVDAALAKHGGHARLVRLRSDREIAAFLAEA